MTRDELLPIIEIMCQRGGSFAKAIATAMRHADGGNLQRILDTFPELVERYKKMLKN